MKSLIATIASLIGNLFAYFAGQKSATNKLKAEAEETAREYERAGSEALIGGLEREQKLRDKGVDTSQKDPFE